MKKDHSFKVVNTMDSLDAVYPVVEMEIDSQATLSDMLDAFASFLKAIGYCPKEGSYLEFISDENDYYEIEEH